MILELWTHPDKSENLARKKAALQTQDILLPKTLFTHDSALCSRNTPEGELTSQPWSTADVLLSFFLSGVYSFFSSSFSFSFSFIFFPELGSNPLKSAGVEASAFVDLKRVSYIRIADTNITEIPKGMTMIYFSTDTSLSEGDLA